MVRGEWRVKNGEGCMVNSEGRATRGEEGMARIQGRVVPVKSAIFSVRMLYWPQHIPVIGTYRKIGYCRHGVKISS